MADICRICGNDKENRYYVIEEMHFGTREKFEYFECSACGCLQIKDIPASMEKYYPGEYYSFSGISKFNKSLFGQICSSMRRIRDYYAITGKGIIGKYIYELFKPLEIFNILGQCNIDRNSRILDVGCGNGRFLYYLNQMGFANTTGIDPYIKENLEYINGLKIFKKEIFDYEESNVFDLVMLNHSFEHISKPLETLIKIGEILKDNGVCMLHVPTIDSYAWQYYGKWWVQIDAPRHLFIFGKKSIEMLARSSGFKLERIIYDSYDYQFWGSEQYKKGISLISEKSYFRNKHAFDKRKIREYRQKAIQLNNEQRGDTAAYILRKSSELLCKPEYYRLA